MLSDLLTLYSFCKKNNIEIIHTHHRYAEFIACIVAKFLKIKTVATVHSLTEGKKYLSFHSDKIIAVSNAVKNMLIEEYHVAGNKIETLYNCIQPPNTKNKIDLTEFRKKMDITSDGKIILFLGRIIKIKNTRLLIDAFTKLNKFNQNIFLLIIGKNYGSSLNQAYGKNIYVMSSVKNPFIYYEMADMVVLPSIKESFPYVMLEAGIMKRPFIGSRTGGIAEFIEDGKNGLLFEPGNIDQLIAKINFVIDNPDKAKILGRKFIQ